MARGKSHHHHEKKGHDESDDLDDIELDRLDSSEDLDGSYGAVTTDSKDVWDEEDEDLDEDEGAETYSARAAKRANAKDRTVKKSCCEIVEDFFTSIWNHPDLVWIRTFNVSHSLWIWEKNSPFRVKVTAVVESEPFDYTILALICISSILLAIEPLPEEDSPYYGFEVVFVLLFTIELILKTIASGFVFCKGAYLRNGWNILDAVVVVFGIMGISSPSLASLGSLRTVRILRPLRTLHAISGMQLMVNALLDSFGHLRDLLALLIFLLFVFGIVGMQFYSGLFLQQCYSLIDGSEIGGGNLCSTDPSFGRQCAEDQFCASGFVNPNYDITSFDNIFKSWLLILQCVSLDQWTQIMYWALDTQGWWHCIYFIVLVAMGNFFTLNLVTTLIAVRFDTAKKNRRLAILQKRAEKEQAKLHIEWYNTNWEQEQANEQQKKKRAEAKEEEDDYDSDEDIYGLETLKKNEEEILHGMSIWSRIALNPYFESFIILIVLINMITLSLDDYYASESAHDAYWGLGVAFWVIYMVEAVIKLLGIGWYRYFTDWPNTVDFIVVILGLVELIGSTSSLRAVAGLRFLRMFALLRSWNPLKDLLGAVEKSFADVLPFGFLLFLFMFTFAVLGNTLYGEHESLEGTRASFDGFYWAMITVFQIITGEKWSHVVYGLVDADGWNGAFFMIICFLLGHVVMLSLFAAVFIGNFQDIQSHREINKLTGLPLFCFRAKVAFYYIFCCDPNYLERAEKAERIKEEKQLEADKQERDRELRMLATAQNVANSPMEAVLDIPEDPDMLARRQNKAPLRVHISRPRVILYGKCLCLEHDNNLRYALAHLLASSLWKTLFSLFIAGSVLLLILDEPDIDESSDFRTFLDRMEVVVAFVYFGEMVMKMVAYGCFHGEAGDYFRNKWNYLDLLIVWVGVVYFFVDLGSSGDSDAVNVLHSLLALRAFRMVTLWDRSRSVLASLFGSSLPFLKVMIIGVLVIIMFGLIGLHAFQGRFRRCYDPYDVELPGVDEIDCTDPNRWINHPWGNFDTLQGSIALLFEVSLLEGWTDFMWIAIDSTEAGKAAETNANDAAGAFFCAYVLVGSLFVISLFVGMVVHEFSRRYASAAGTKLTPQDRVWIKTHHQVIRQAPGRERLPRAEKGILKFCYKLVEHPNFEKFIMVAITANIILISTSYEGMTQDYEDRIDLGNAFFTFLFVLEAIVKLLAWGGVQYFVDPWNLFDFVIVGLSVFTFVVERGVEVFELGFDIVTFRIFRVLRLFRLIKRAEGLRMLIHTLYSSFSNIVQIAFILAIAHVTYAIAGMRLLGDIIEGEYLNSDANFQTFWISMLTLFRCATGEDWNRLMDDARVTEPNCSNAEGNCGRPVIALVYFSSFVVLTTFLVLNVFVAILLKNFEQEVNIAPNPVRYTMLENFGRQWAKYYRKQRSSLENIQRTINQRLKEEPSMQTFPLGPEIELGNFSRAHPLPEQLSEHLLHYTQVELFLRLVDRPLGFKDVPRPHDLSLAEIQEWEQMDEHLEHPSQFNWLTFIVSRNIPLSQGEDGAWEYVHYMDLLLGLCHYLYRVEYPHFDKNFLPLSIQVQLHEAELRAYPDLYPENTISDDGELPIKFTLGEKEAVNVVTRLHYARIQKRKELASMEFNNRQAKLLEEKRMMTINQADEEEKAALVEEERKKREYADERPMENTGVHALQGVARTVMRNLASKKRTEVTDASERTITYPVDLCDYDLPDLQEDEVEWARICRDMRAGALAAGITDYVPPEASWLATERDWEFKSKAEGENRKRRANSNYALSASDSDSDRY